MPYCGQRFWTRQILTSCLPTWLVVNYFLNSLRFGFDMLVSITDIPTYECRNALSARNNPGIVTRLLQEEIDKGFIRGPFSKPPFKQYRNSNSN
jgi:hypothetical protein